MKISKSQKLTPNKKNLGLKKKWLHQDTTIVVPIVLWDPCSRLAQAHNSTGSPEHGARVEEPRHFRTAAWKPNVVFCFSETSNWNTIFFISPDIFSQLVGYVLSECTCWQCDSLYSKQQRFHIEKFSVQLSPKGFGSCPSGPIHPIHLGSFAGSPNFWTQITVFSNENLPQYIWQNHNRILQS